MNPTFDTVFFCALVILTVFSIASAYLSTRKGQASSRWVRTSATVTECEIQSDKKGKQFYPKLTYRYEVRGVTQTSSTISLNDIYLGSYERASAVLENIALESEITIYYNPLNPREAVFLRGADWSNFFVVCFSLLLLCGLYYYLWL